MATQNLKIWKQCIIVYKVSLEKWDKIEIVVDSK